MEAAVAIRQGLEAGGIGCKEGIAEGRVYCGLVGSPDRCEYAMMGASVNLAARLMGKCEPGQILVSETVYLSSQSVFVYTALPRMHAKGYPTPVAVYSPTERVQGNVLLRTNTNDNVGFVGRTVEMNLLMQSLVQVRTATKSTAFVIEGPPSVGKTRLAAEAVKLASQKCEDLIKVAASAASAAHNSTPYYVVRLLLEQILGVTASESGFNNGSVRSYRHRSSSIEASTSLRPVVDYRLESGLRLWIQDNVPEKELDSAALSKPKEFTPSRKNSWRDSRGWDKLRSHVRKSVRVSLEPVRRTEEGMPSPKTTSSPQAHRKGMDDGWSRVKLYFKKQKMIKIWSTSVSERSHGTPDQAQTSSKKNSLIIEQRRERNPSSEDSHSGQLGVPLLNNVPPSLVDESNGIPQRKKSLTLAGMFGSSGSVKSSLQPIPTRLSNLHLPDPMLSSPVRQQNPTPSPMNAASILEKKHFMHTYVELKWRPDLAVGKDKFELEEIIPLLGEVFGATLHESTTTKDMSREAKHILLDLLILRLLLASVDRGDFPVDVFLVDNLQWCDWPSLRILLRLVKRLPRGVFIGTTRSVADIDRVAANCSTTERHRRQLAITAIMDEGLVMRPPPLSSSEIQLIVEQILGAKLLLANPSVLSDSNVEHIRDRAGGSPFLVSVLATGLKNALLSGKYTGVQDLPSGADNVAISTFDHLSKAEQATVKTASVIGYIFEEGALRHALREQGLSMDGTMIHACLDRLVASSLVVLESVVGHDAKDRRYRFSDHSVQESIYNLMLAAQKEHVHGIIGKYLEGAYGAEGSDKFEEIALHYSLSDIISKKTEYLERSATMSKTNHCYDLAFRNYMKLVKMATGLGADELLQQSLGPPRAKSYFSFVFNFLQKLSSVSSIFLFTHQTENPELSVRSKDLRRWMSAVDFRHKISHLSIASGDDYQSVCFHPDTVTRWLAQLGMSLFM